jgi:integrase/recombinase XerD
MRLYLEDVKVKGYSESAVRAAEFSLSPFILFCHERAVTTARDVTKPMIERYQRHLYQHRKANGQPLSIVFQRGQLTYIKLFFRWLAKGNYIPSNPASDIELPKAPIRLPQHVLSVEEAERVLAVPDLSTPVGLRDRVILETFYSTGIRRRELSRLKLYDVDFERGVLMIRQGKGRKDRVIPIGERALAWIEKYLSDGRPSLVLEPDDGTVFLASRGGPLNPDVITSMAHSVVEKAGILKKGACHLFRHTAATLMLEGGADIRYVQEMLGHASLDTTQIYTRVSISKLKQIHTATHPGARMRPAARTEESPQEAEVTERPPVDEDPPDRRG